MPRGFNQQTFHCDQSKGIAKKNSLSSENVTEAHIWRTQQSCSQGTQSFSLQFSIFSIRSPCGFQVCLICILHAISCAQVAGRHEKCSVEHLFLQPSFQTSSCFIEGQTVYLCLVCWIMPEGSITFILFAVDWPLNSMPQISNQSC